MLGWRVCTVVCCLVFPSKKHTRRQDIICLQATPISNPVFRCGCFRSQKLAKPFFEWRLLKRFLPFIESVSP